MGVHVENVYELGSDIKDVGWDDAETARAIAIEIKPGTDELLDFNDKLVSESCGRLPPFDREKVRYAALSCNHTHLFLRCVAAGLPSDDQTMSVSGRLSVAAFAQHDEDFASAIQNGLTWEILSWKVREHYPEAIPLISEARNVGGQVNRRENEMQILKKIHNLAAKAESQGLVPDWAKIKRAVCRSKPPCKQMVPELCFFVQKNGGGKSGWALQHLAQC